MADWKNRIDRWHREGTVLENVFMLSEPELVSHMRERGLVLSHPVQYDAQGLAKQDTSKWLVVRKDEK